VVEVADAIRVYGLADFSRSLKRLDSDLPKVLRLAMNEAADVVVTAARMRVPKRSGRAARSLQPRSTRTMVRVAAGGRRAPYYPWLDFGGRVGRNRTARRAFIPDGRYIYPAYNDNRERFLQIMQKALVDVARSAGVEVT
jgi:hypothetical protein